MKNKFIIALVILFIFPVSLFSEFNQKSFIPASEIILADLHKLIHSKNIQRNNNVYSAVSLCYEKFKTKELAININNNIPKNIYQGMQFQFSRDNSSIPVILMSPYLIKIYKTHPSIVLSALVHEMQHAKSYFDNTKFFAEMFSSTYENYLYELDSYNIEANFIISYLIPEKYKLTRFEKLLSGSYKEDNLDSFSFLLIGHDMRVAFDLKKIEIKKVSYDKKIQAMYQFIKKIHDTKFDKSDNKWVKYKKTVPLYSVLKFAPQVIRNIETKGNKIADHNNYHMNNQNPGLYKLLISLVAKFNKVKPYYTSFLSMSQRKFKSIE